MPSNERMTTELEAVNQMLATVGESPINTVIGDYPAAIQIAIDLLRHTSRSTQAFGWHFNTEHDFELSINQDGEIELPGNTLDVDLTQEDWSVDVVQRGLRLYDKQNHSYVFDKNMRVTLVVMLPWDELNQPLRTYITIKAARVYQDQTVGSSDHHVYTQQDEMQAYIAFQNSNAENEDNSIFDSYDTGSIMRRRRPHISQF